MNKKMFEQYYLKFFELLNKTFENDLSYKYKLLFLKNEQYNKYTVSLAIDVSNNGERNKVAYFTYKDFMSLNREKQLEYMGNFYNAEIMGKDENEFEIEDAEIDFLKICNFNYLRDKEEKEL